MYFLLKNGDVIPACYVSLPKGTQKRCCFQSLQRFQNPGSTSIGVITNRCGTCGIEPQKSRRCDPGTGLFGFLARHFLKSEDNFFMPKVLNRKWFLFFNPPNHPFVHKVLHYFHHPFCGFYPFFWETSTYLPSLKLTASSTLRIGRFNTPKRKLVSSSNHPGLQGRKC